MAVMKLDSPIFDRIRVKPDRRRPRAQALAACEWEGCANAGTHRAPKGRTREQEYWCFCLDHVREYNQSYNFFAGMSDEAIARYQKESVTGHRPTWRLGSMGGGRRARGDANRFTLPPEGADDLFGVFEEIGSPSRFRAAGPEKPARTVHNAARRALESLGLGADATRTVIKARFKELVKRHHPDANGGDRGSEERLREIIQAYNYLKSARLC